MPTNYDSSQVGVPYVRSTRIIINYPGNNAPATALIEQALVVKLLDGTTRKLQDLQALNVTLDLVLRGTDPIPLVNPGTGAPLGSNTTLNTVMLQILAVVRAKQIELNP